jgi:cell division septation protein DedD
MKDMISVLDYTRKLLFEHDCVVLPELGGFLVYFSHAFYSEQNALYHAPQKRVAFNEALKLDDGLLAHYLTINEQITREDAQKRIRQFVEDIKQAIRENGSFLLEGIGSLSINEEAKLQFEPLSNVNFYAESYGLKSIHVAQTEPALEIEENTPAYDWTRSDRTANELTYELPRRRRSRVGMYVGGFLIAGCALIAGITQLPSESLKSSLNPFELVSAVKAWFPSDIKSNTVNNSLESTAIAVALPVDNESVTVKNPTPALPAAVESAKLPVSAPKETVSTLSSSEAAKFSYKSDEKTDFLVIAGGFSNVDNARKLERKLQRNGYENAHILNPEPTDGKLIIVAAIGCENAKKAKSQLTRVSFLSGANAYVLRQ